MTRHFIVTSRVLGQTFNSKRLCCLYGGKREEGEKRERRGREEGEKGEKREVRIYSVATLHPVTLFLFIYLSSFSLNTFLLPIKNYYYYYIFFLPYFSSSLHPVTLSPHPKYTLPSNNNNNNKNIPFYIKTKQTAFSLFPFPSPCRPHPHPASSPTLSTSCSRSCATFTSPR